MKTLLLVHTLNAATVLGGNFFAAGPLPAYLNQLPALSVLHLQGTGASLGAIPAEWGALPALRSLKLASAALDGASFSCLVVLGGWL